MSTPAATPEDCACRHPASPGANLSIVKDQPVALRDLAEQLGITFAALHQQVTAGRVPVLRLSERRGAPLYVTAEIARQVRDWHTANRFRPWPTFPITDPPEQG